jgi:hypothetical protein
VVNVRRGVRASLEERDIPIVQWQHNNLLQQYYDMQLAFEVSEVQYGLRRLLAHLRVRVTALPQCQSLTAVSKEVKPMFALLLLIMDSSKTV